MQNWQPEYSNLDDLDIVRPIKSDKICHVTILILNFKQLKKGCRNDIQSLSNLMIIFIIVLMTPARICPDWPSKINGIKICITTATNR